MCNNYYTIAALTILINDITMRTLSISLQESLYDRLKHSIPSKKISQFVSNAISHELARKEEELTRAYQEAEKANDRQELLNEWDLANDFYKK